MNGIIVINKPKDYTSHDVVNILRKTANMKRVGHTGTLDPIAQGVLVICLGKATKISEFLLSSDKKYIADIKFGYETDSLDASGETIKTTDKIPEKSELIKALDKFKGEINQIPPMYSALKYKGKKLYEYAREGKVLDLKARKVNIKSLELIDQLDKGLYRIEIECSSGTYIRSLIRDLAYELSSYATMQELIRTKSSKFDLSMAYDIDYIKSIDKDKLESLLIPIDDALSNMKSYKVADFFYKGITNGRIYKTNPDNSIMNQDLKIYCRNEFIGIGSYVEKDDIKGIKIKKMLKGD